VVQLFRNAIPLPPPPMPYRRTANVERRLAARHAAIIAAARQAASEGGMAAVQIAAVAQRAGIAAGTVYRYFPGKTDLVAALLTEISEREIAALRRAAEFAPGPLSALSAAIMTFGARALRDRRLAFAVTAEPIEAELDAARLSFRKALSAEFSARIAAAAARTFAGTGCGSRRRSAGRPSDRSADRAACGGRGRPRAGAFAVAGSVCLARAWRRRCAGARPRGADSRQRSVIGGQNERQCDISAGIVSDRNIEWVTPPSTNSRSREWP
jgi:AcrR family transcriptional regulator